MAGRGGGGGGRGAAYSSSSGSASARTCSVCGQAVDGDIRLLNHMMERHGFRNPNAGGPDRNSRGY